ncbi:neuronal calcium sensor 1-like isoform X2 [Symsagittifera roscoffensis]|uniref:neuronal calcium sensor 1-like isoform X2 n=2 Tax=Symsagittifera roscoffensis TaxID=84072 RepID=UPI00307C7A92
MISEGEPSSTVGRPQRRMAVAIGMNVGGSSPDRSTSGNHFFATASTHFSRMKKIWSKITTASSAFSAIHNAEDILDELDLQMVHAKPHSIEQLTRNTLFERHEIKDIYRRFKQECPNGYLTEETFRRVFQQFFPVGDTNQYAHFVFNTFERDPYGNVLFQEFLQTMSVILKGSTEDKLEWIFKLYDIDRDEVLSRQDLRLMVESVYYMVGKDCEAEESAVSLHVDNIINKYSANRQTNEITFDEFKEACGRNPEVFNSIDCFGSGIFGV